MTQNEDLALQTLLSVRDDLEIDLNEQLLKSCYAIQKKHQFDKDRAQTIQAMERLIEEHVDALASGKEKDLRK